MTNTKTKHTPGPWEVKIADYSTRILGNDGKTQIALIIEDNGISFHPSEANARLIASAPELLEACKNALTDPDDDHARKMIEDAILKAEGSI